MARKPRLDELLVARGFFASVHEAQAAVLAGEVVVGEHRETSAGKRLDSGVSIRLKSKKEKDRMGFASRGGGKLEAALCAFPVDPAGMRCVDLGASTGGFTDCLLQHGAARVSAVDVGTNQFAWRLRQDPRVEVFEQTDVRGIDVARVGGPFDLAVADLSFVRLESVLSDVRRLLNPGASFISLVKPQFEVARSEVGERGVVRDPELHASAIGGVLCAAAQAGFEPRGLTWSPVKGPKGNIEFLLWSKRLGTESGARASMESIDNGEVERVVAEAHERLGGS